jgi:hypothetical protein
MHHPGKTAPAEDGPHSFQIADVGLAEDKTVPAQPGEPGLFQGRIIVPVQVVHTRHPVPLFQQGPTDMVPDETGRAGDEDVHGGLQNVARL